MPRPHSDRKSQMRDAAPARNVTNDAADAPRGKAEWLWLAAFAALALLVGCVQIDDPDIWWHLRTGQLIYQRAEIPRTDWFTYTNPESPWIDLHWGFQLVAAALWRLGGAAALVIFKSTLGAITFAIAWSAGRRAWPVWQGVACWLPSLMVYEGRNLVRPEMFSFLFLAAELAIVFHARSRPRLLWSLPLIQVLWINMHGLFVLGLMVWFCFLAGEIIERRTHTQWRLPLAVTALMLGAALLNPYGLDGALFPLVLLQRIQGADHPFYTQFSAEFRGFPEFIHSYGAAAILGNLTTLSLVVLFVLGLLSFVPLMARRSVSWFRVLAFAAFAYLAWQASRNSVLFALVGGVVLRANLGEWLATRPPRPERKFHLGPVALAAVLGFLFVGVPFDLLTIHRAAAIQRLFGLGELPGAFAHGAAEFLGRQGMPRHCFAIDEGAAAVYIFHNGPERTVFADARLEVNTRRTLERYLEIERQIATSDPRLIESLTEGIAPAPDGTAEVPALLISLQYLVRNPPLARGVAMLKTFRTVYVDDVAMVLIEERQAERMKLPRASDAELPDVKPGTRPIRTD